MTAILIQPSPVRSDNPADYMPFTVRMDLAILINEAWAEFAAMYSGPLVGKQCAEAFRRYLTR